MSIQLPEDPIMVEMLPDFVESWQHDISTTFENIVNLNDEAELYRFGHTLKGSGRQFGVAKMAEYGSAIQEFARAKQWESARALKQPMLDTILQVKHYLVSNGLMKADTANPDNSDVPSNM